MSNIEKIPDDFAHRRRAYLDVLDQVYANGDIDADGRERLKQTQQRIGLQDDDVRALEAEYVQSNVALRLERRTAPKRYDNVIIIARCTRMQQPSGLVIESRGNDEWVITKSFPVPESQASKTRPTQSNISGSFSIASSYAGCVHCGDQGLAKCGCGKLACYDGTSKSTACPWCHHTASFGGQVSDIGSALSDL